MITRHIVFILVILCVINILGKSFKKPNVVLIIIDNLSDLPEGFYGHPQAETPHMKALGIFGTMNSHTQCHLKILNDYFKTKNYSSELCLGTKRSGAELFW